MSKLNNSFIRLGGRPSSKIQDARSKLSIVSNQPASLPALPLLKIASSIQSAISGDSIICEVCLQRKSSSQFTNLAKCQHLFCKQCTSAYLTTKIFVNEVEIKCLHEECTQELDENLEVFQQLPQNIKQQYQKIKENKSIIKNPLLSHCPTADCPQILQRPNRESPFYCPTCQKMFCPVCLLQEHIGQCDSFAEIYLKNNYMYKKCSNCRMIVEKADGCDHITCACGYQFCYNCGGRYTPQHNCWFYEQLNEEDPISTTQRILNHIALPFATVLIVVGILLLLIASELILLVLAPLAVMYQIITKPCCPLIVNAILAVVAYPLIVVGVFIYGQSILVNLFFSWCDFGARLISYLKR